MTTLRTALEMIFERAKITALERAVYVIKVLALQFYVNFGNIITMLHVRQYTIQLYFPQHNLCHLSRKVGYSIDHVQRNEYHEDADESENP